MWWPVEMVREILEWRLILGGNVPAGDGVELAAR